MEGDVDSEISENERSDLFQGFKDVNSYSQGLLRAVLQATVAANGLPTAGDQYDFYHSFKGFRHLMREDGKRLLSLMTSVMNQQGETGYFEGKELEDVVEQLVAVNDMVLERASSEMDDAAGIKKKEDAIVLSTVRTTKIINTSWNRKNSGNTAVSYQLLAAKNIVRPQLKFKDSIDNSRSPFIPIIKEKPNSIKPLAILVETIDGEEEYSHPYEMELEKFTPRDDELQLVTKLEQPLPIERTELIVIDKIEDLQKLCEELRKQKAFAVDLEHHSYRTFQGITCLMQISTRDKDYIVDVIELRKDVYILNEVFTDPKIVKVFHGADMDILWLQRDFGIYVVNMFDTGQAARMLGLAHFSLQYIMSHYCEINLNKQFQLADWRIRPLPSEMLKYAREDTHYLLHIYNCMKNELINRGNAHKNLLRAVFDNSKQVCLKRYRKQVFKDTSYLELYRRSKKAFNTRQLFALSQLYAWRDKMARVEDESTGYVLPNHMLLQIAELLPREQQGILACCNPIPPLVRQQLNELHAIIYKAREKSLQKLEVPESHLSVSSSQFSNPVSHNNAIDCPHDLPPSDDRVFPTLLDLKNAQLPQTSLKLLKRNSEVSIFDSSSEESHPEEQRKLVQSMFKDFISPYERYTISRASNPDANTEEPIEAEVQKPPEHNIPTDEERVQRIQEFYKNLVTKAQEEENFQGEEMAAQKWNNETPLRTRGRKRKRTSKIWASTIPLSSVPEKMTKMEGTQERLAVVVPPYEPSTSFQPYDYENVPCQPFRPGRKQKTKDFTPNENQNFRGGKRRGQKKKGNQMTYNRNNQKPSRQQWPSRQKFC